MAGSLCQSFYSGVFHASNALLRKIAIASAQQNYKELKEVVLFANLVTEFTGPPKYYGPGVGYFPKAGLLSRTSPGTKNPGISSTEQEKRNTSCFIQISFLATLTKDLVRRASVCTENFGRKGVHAQDCEKNIYFTTPFCPSHPCSMHPQ